MFHPIMAVFVFLLFFILTPGILVRLPLGYPRVTVALTHAFIFTAIWCLVHKTVWNVSTQYEGSVLL